MPYNIHMTKRWLFTLIFLSYQFSQSKLGGVNQKTLDYYTYRETKSGVDVCQCSPFCLRIVPPLTEQSLFGMEQLSTFDTGAGFHHPAFALHQSCNSSTIPRNLPITGASILSQCHETALSLRSPSPSKKNSSITSSGQRPPRVNITSWAWQPCIHHTCCHCFRFAAGCPNIQCLFSPRGQSKAAVLPPVMSPGGRFVSQILYLVTSWEIFGRAETPISEAIKQSADWDHPTNAPYLFNKLSRGRGPVLVSPNLTVTRPDHGHGLQKMSSCRWPFRPDKLLTSSSSSSSL